MQQAAIIERESAGFAGPESLARIAGCLEGKRGIEVVLDFETTGTTPWARGNKLGDKIGLKQTLKQYCAANGCAYDDALRARVLSLHIPGDANDLSIAVDLDRLTADEKHSLAGLLDEQIWVGHNLLFEYMWMLSLNPSVRPMRLVDTMLLTTCIRPDAMYRMQQIVVSETLGGNLASGHQRKHLSALNDAAIKLAAAGSRNSGDDSGGAVGLSALALWLFDEKLDKSYQKPINWWPGCLSPAHFAYCMGDVDVPRRASRALLGIPLNADMRDLLRAINQHKGGSAYKSMEAALHVLVRMQRKGLLWSKEAAAALSEALEKEASEAMQKLIRIAPSLSGFRDQLLSTDGGLNEALKTALEVALKRETGQNLPKTAKGNASLNAADLKLAFPNSKVAEAWQGVQHPVSERKKIEHYESHVAEDGRIHPMTSIVTITGRTSSQEPNLQNIPRDPRFRAIFVAAPGHKLIATDFSSIELRIVAALGVRAWRVLHAILAGRGGDPHMRELLGQQIDRVGWIFRAVPELAPFLKNPTGMIIPPRIAQADPAPNMQDNPPIEAWALAAAHNLCVLVQKIRAVSGGLEARLPFRLAYTKGLDPHIITALAMEAQGGRFNLKGMPPIQYVESLTPEERESLKKRMKEPRQSAKAVGFGLIYGMSADALWTYGIQSYGLSWDKADAHAAKEAYFDLFPEVGLWHWLLKYAFSVKMDIFSPYNPLEMRPESDGGKVYTWYTLSGRPTMSSKMTSGANYQDQGSGAEIAFRALAALPPDVQDMVVNFVHDEIVLECPNERVEEVAATLERTMIGAADSLLLTFGIPTEVESAVGDCWIH